MTSRTEVTETLYLNTVDEWLRAHAWEEGLIKEWMKTLTGIQGENIKVGIRWKTGINKSVYGM